MYKSKDQLNQLKNEIFNSKLVRRRGRVYIINKTNSNLNLSKVVLSIKP